MTLHYTIWCLLTVCGGWLSVSVISLHGGNKNEKHLERILSVSSLFMLAGRFILSSSVYYKVYYL